MQDQHPWSTSTFYDPPYASVLLPAAPFPTDKGLQLDSWCSKVLKEPMWDGVDFSPCFLAKTFEGLLPLAYISISLAASTIYLIVIVMRRSRRSTATRSPIPSDTASPSEARMDGPNSMEEEENKEEENKIILEAVMEENPGLSLEELLGRTLDDEDGFPRRMGSNGVQYTPADPSSAGAVLELEGRTIASKAFFLAAWRTKKELFELAGSTLICYLLAMRYFESQGRFEGSAWLRFGVLAWGWTTLLLLLQSSMAFTAHLQQIQHSSSSRHLPRLHSFLEFHTIPWFTVYSIISFIYFRSTLIHYFNAPVSLDTSFAHCTRDGTVFTSTLLLLLVEGFAPRLPGYDISATPSTATPPCPPALELNASLFSHFTLGFLNPFLFRNAFASTNQASISTTTIPDSLPKYKAGRTLLDYRLDTSLFGRWKTTPLGLTASLFWYFRMEVLEQHLWALLHVVLEPSKSLVLMKLLQEIGKRWRGEDAPTHVLLLAAVGLFSTTVVSHLVLMRGLVIGRKSGVRIKSILMGEVFTKALRRSGITNADNASLHRHEVGRDSLSAAGGGKILNLASVDVDRVAECIPWLQWVWPDVPLQISLIMCLLYRILGVSALFGIATLVAFTCAQSYAWKSFGKHTKRLASVVDIRLKLASEVVGSIYPIKFFAYAPTLCFHSGSKDANPTPKISRWEPKITEHMRKTRESELCVLWSINLTTIALNMLLRGAPIVVSAVTFLVHTQVFGRELSAETAFPALTLLILMQNPLVDFSNTVNKIIEARVSIVRISQFLQELDTEKYTSHHGIESNEGTRLGFENGSFSLVEKHQLLCEASAFHLKDLNLSFPTGEVSIILGPVGAGKSTLLLSLLGETTRLSGSSMRPSRMFRSTEENLDPTVLTNDTAYCSQSPWLLNRTVRANILFGSTFDEARYRDVVDACALRQDFAQFEFGDDSEVGERGIVVSGGQKARICLARAVYSSANILLLDDVLSAVDSHTRQHLFENCLKSPLMKNRTCILVTHAVDLCLPGSAFFVSLDNGRVIDSGIPTEATFTQIGIPKVPSTSSTSSLTATLESIPSEDKTPLGDKIKSRLLSVHQEARREGAVSWRDYRLYISGMGGWRSVWPITVLCILLQLAEMGVSLAFRSWVASYHTLSHTLSSSDSTELLVFNLGISTTHSLSLQPALPALSQRSSQFWMQVYAALAVAQITIHYVCDLSILLRCIAASRYLYNQFFDRLMHAPSRWWSTTPTGQILNRFGHDMERIDVEIPRLLGPGIKCAIMVALILTSIAVVFPSFLLTVPFTAGLYCAVAYVYVSTNQEVKRIESISRSPIVGLFSEVIHGASTIRAYGDSGRWTKELIAFQNVQNRANWILWASLLWFAMRITWVSATMTLCVALFIIFNKSMDPSTAGFVLMWCLIFNNYVFWLIRNLADLQLGFNSVERVREYLEVPQENKGGQSPPAIWPTRNGTIEVEHFSASYAPELPLVLRDVTFRVQPREKIGICGRTGSGKSTLGLSFFRFIEATSGRIVIDGLDISTLKLSDLRSRLNIIPQESSLFSGTVRFNLDPFNLYDDASIWDALRRVKMASSVDQPGTGTSSGVATPSSNDTVGEEGEGFSIKSLDAVISDGGKNFSAGQRQLIAIARALLKLRDSSILILDESTASLDNATDEFIQRTIREEMQDATILCVAHRLRTIIDYDKILVLGDGQVLEFGPPWELLQNENSAFTGLCKRSGEELELRELAQAARAKKEQI